MKSGIAESIPEQTSVRSVRSRVLNLPSPTGGGGTDDGGPNGNNGELPDFLRLEDDTAPVQDKSRFIAWFLLLAVGMTFAGLLGAYLMIATNRAAEWQPFALPFQIWISTALILLSSITYSLAKRSIDHNNYRSGRNWLIATTALGGTFVSSQIIVWLELTNRGFYMRGNPYAGFFYILTAAHLAHVAGGLIALGSILLKTWNPSSGEADSTRRRALARSVGWYWHFMGVLWVVLFLMLGFWK
ncbi:MAG: heme-copper oxidase subunit III [Acidobacteria bacterium]|nr:heme-copper oxidase subunit III [Acidobacteriota bacterium]